MAVRNSILAWLPDHWQKAGQEMNDTNIRCRNCRFFDRHGKCRRYPPKVFVTANGPDMKFLRHLPDVSADEYCGEFETKAAYVPAAMLAGHR